MVTQKETNRAINKAVTLLKASGYTVTKEDKEFLRVVAEEGEYQKENPGEDMVQFLMDLIILEQE